MKQLGNIKESKDITNKEYVDQKDAELDQVKLEESDLSELPNSRVLELWNKYIGNGEGGGEGGSGSDTVASVKFSNDISVEPDCTDKAVTPKAVCDYVQKVAIEGISGISSSTITAIEVMDKEEYDNLTEKSPTTLYLTKG